MSSALQHPARLLPIAFLFAIAVGTLLLMLPFARAGAGAAPFLVALFTSTSAVCVTGLVVVDTATYWSGFGRGVILLLFQLGGLGIMTAATVLGLLMARRFSLTSRLAAVAETRGDLGDVKAVLRLVLVATVAIEAVTAVILAVRFHATYAMPWLDASWHALFHSVSAFNNAGFSTWSDSLAGYATDAAVLGPIMLAVVVGGIGFPVLLDLRRQLRTPSRWSLHTKITLLGTAALLILGALAIGIAEWDNPSTLGPLGVASKMLNAAFHSVMPRTAGFNSLDVGQFRPGTIAVNDMLMFIGGGSAGTAGGIKVSTLFLIGLIVWAEIRGEPDSVVFRRRLSSGVQREALAVVVLAIATISFATLILVSVSDLPLERLLFEAISAFSTVGLSMGITAQLPASGQAVLIVLMFVGRVGTITIATALALQRRRRPYRYPEERPIVG